MAAVLRLAIASLIAIVAANRALLVVQQQVNVASISTDKTQYLPGDSITICYSVPGPGPITITDYSSDGSSAVLAAYDDDGTGGCIVAAAQGPASTERLVLTWASGNESGSVEATYQVVNPETTHVVTLADAGTTVTVAVGDTVDLALGDVLNWQVTAPDASVLQPVSATLPNGVQGIWTAVGVGQTTITGQGDPRCLPGCGAPSRLFSVTIAVIPASRPMGQAMATVHGVVVMSDSGASAGAGIPVSAVIARNGSAKPVATALTDDGGSFTLTFALTTTAAPAPIRPPRSFWVFVPRTAAESFVRLSAAELQQLPDGTAVLAWQVVDFTNSADASVTLGISVSA